MPSSLKMTDSRPKTAVLLQFTGIGDLIWHIAYFKAVAQQSKSSKVTVIAQPSTMATAIIGGAPWVDKIITHDHRPRRGEKRKGRHAGFFGMKQMADELRLEKLDRIVLFSGRPSRGLMAWMSGIQIREGYGYNLLQRIFLTQGPYIKKYKGSAVAVLKETSQFAIAHAYCDHALVPRMDVPSVNIETAKTILRSMPKPLITLAIGTSEPNKQWGCENFTRLATTLIEQQFGVVIIGGPSEYAMAQEIVDGIPEGHRSSAITITDSTILGSAAIVKLSSACIGNDTGMVNIAAAVLCPTFVLLGSRPVLDHDPLIRSLLAPSLAEVRVEAVLSALSAAGIMPTSSQP